jgi:hypothetical protein
VTKLPSEADGTIEPETLSVTAAGHAVGIVGEHGLDGWSEVIFK